MSNVIGFLEQAGRNPALRHANRAQLLRSMQDENIEPTLQRALLRSQRSAIDSLLGVRETMHSPNTVTLRKELDSLLGVREMMHSPNTVTPRKNLNSLLGVRETMHSPNTVTNAPMYCINQIVMPPKAPKKKKKPAK